MIPLMWRQQQNSHEISACIHLLKLIHTKVVPVVPELTKRWWWLFEKYHCIENGENFVYMIQYFDLKGLSLTNIKAELDSILGESAPSFTTVKCWVAEFNGGCMICRNNHRSGRPNEWMTKNGEENPQSSTGCSLTENSRDS
ncbi:mariner transposase [Trichonephila clavipes]|nr:mariner transposase [Trichonephila clavipes]